MTSVDKQEQIAQAEEILGDRLEAGSFAKGLFFGQCRNDALPRYPIVVNEATTERVTQLADFCHAEVDSAEIDRQAEISRSVIDGLGRLGVLGACLPRNCGGLELTQTEYCRLLEVLGGHCGSTALFVNAHHSIGPRALVLFGTKEQQERWLPKLASGEWISAFALTEPEAGSDAANVQSTATPTDDGRGYLINGEKRWITNGGIADVLTVMARTPASGGKSKVTAFIVTPDMEGFEVVEQRMEKVGVRGTATSRLAFHDMFVPRENVLGELGKGLRVALTVLDFGRTTFGASCTGAAKFCVDHSVQHANRRVQFGETLGSFELVKQKLASMAANTFAMESCTYQTAALIDSGVGDFMLETAMLKVFSTDALWEIINDTIQIYGGKGYFTDEPFERMMRDARINMIGEGANDVLRAFSALVGMRDVGLELEGVVEAIKHPFGGLGRLGRFAGRKLDSLFATPSVAISSSELEIDAVQLGRLIAKLGTHVERLLATYRVSIVDRQYQLGRIADAATELYVGICVLRRLDALIRDGDHDGQHLRANLETGRYYLQTSHRRIRDSFRELWNNDDEATTSLANRLLSM